MFKDSIYEPNKIWYNFFGGPCLDKEFCHKLCSYLYWRFGWDLHEDSGSFKLGREYARFEVQAFCLCIGFLPFTDGDSNFYFSINPHSITDNLKWFLLDLDCDLVL